jgi:gas vesicle protein GvpA/GvpJ/GvpM family
MAREVGRPDEHAAFEQTDLGPDDGEQLVLSDLINRVLDKGVVISGHVTISVADIDLIALDLRLLITSIQTAMARRTGADASPAP